MNTVPNFFSAFYTTWAAVMKAIRAVCAVAVYALALYCTYVAEFICIGLSYTLPHADVVMMWTGFLLLMTGLWAGAGMAILALWQKKKRDDAHLVLFPISFLATCAVAVAGLLAAAAAMWSPSGRDALAFAIMFAALAASALQFLFGQAVRAWQGVYTSFV